MKAFPSVLAAVCGLLGGASIASAQCHHGGAVYHGHSAPPPIFVGGNCGPYGCNRPDYGYGPRVPIGFVPEFDGRDVVITPNPGAFVQRNSNVAPAFQGSPNFQQQQNVPQFPAAPRQAAPQQAAPQPNLEVPAADPQGNFASQPSGPSSPFFNVPEQRIPSNSLSGGAGFTPPNGGFNPQPNSVNGGGSRAPVQQFVSNPGNGGVPNGNVQNGGVRFNIENQQVNNGGVRFFNAPPANRGNGSASPVNGGGVRAPATFAPPPQGGGRGRR